MKNILTSSVVAAMAAVVATPSVNADATVYGKLNASIDYITVDANASF